LDGFQGRVHSLSKPAAEGGRMNHVLIIDDEADFGFFVKKNLELNERYAVAIATDGWTGLKMARETQPDVILLDIMMPQMDGIEVLKQLRNQNISPKSAVIMLTARKDPESITSAIGLSSAMYVVKPIEMDILERKIDSLMKNREIENSIHTEFAGCLSAQPSVLDS
jgi:DNA-binding response OmpR family regulator